MVRSPGGDTDGARVSRSIRAVVSLVSPAPFAPSVTRPARPSTSSHAIDTVPEAAAEWLIDLTGDTITWRRAHQKAAVAVRGPLTDLLLVIYERRPPRGDGIEVFGDTALLEFWPERVSFG